MGENILRRNQMSFYTGTGASVQIGKEAVFNTPATPDTLVDITSEGVKVAVEKGDEGSLLASKTVASRDLLSITVSGSLSFILKPEFAGLLFHLALGGEDEVSQDENGNSVHRITLCGANEDLPSATLVIDRKVAVKKYSGVTISSLSIDAVAGDYVKGSVELQGVKEEAGTLNTAVKSFTVPSYRCTQAVFRIGDEVFDISSCSLKLDNALETAPKTYASGLYAGQPQHGRRSVTITFEIPYKENIETLKDDYLTTEKNASVELFFTSSNAEYSVKTIIPNLSINDVSANVGGTGILTASVSGEALSIGETEPVTVEITDKTTTPYGE